MFAFIFIYFVIYILLLSCREKVKGSSILSKLEENITSHHMLHCSLGNVQFFEFALKNPYPTDQAVLITWEDRELSLVVYLLLIFGINNQNSPLGKGFSKILLRS